jgi:hypothetical protein
LLEYFGILLDYFVMIKRPLIKYFVLFRYNPGHCAAAAITNFLVFKETLVAIFCFRPCSRARVIIDGTRCEYTSTVCLHANALSLPRQAHSSRPRGQPAQKLGRTVCHVIENCPFYVSLSQLESAPSRLRVGSE